MNVKQITPVEKMSLLAELPVFAGGGYHLQPFDEVTITFLDRLSKTILADNSINRIAEMAALGFWLRKSNIDSIRKENAHLFDDKHFVTAPIGTVFHVCPANVDTMFFYSLTISLLMGNKNILRVSSRMDAPAMMVLFEHINKLLEQEQFNRLGNYINIITYGHDKEISEYLSLHSNARMIWGGDNTIETFKSFKTAPRTKDIVFADRVSILCIKCTTYNALEGKSIENFANLFLNDTYTFDQKGCSSPQVIYFIGGEQEYDGCIAKMQQYLDGYTERRYKTEIDSLASLKFNQLVDDVISGRVEKKYGNNYCTFVEMRDQSNCELPHSCGGGYFYVQRIEDIKGLKSVVSARLQTITYFGLSETELGELKNLANDEGIDRIVPLGMALTFNYIWDGYNLLDELSRKVYFKSTK
jgi:hypothetical protein